MQKKDIIFTLSVYKMKNTSYKTPTKQNALS